MIKRRGILPDPAGLFGLVTFIALSALAGSKALQDGDTLWHIKVGQIILERGEILTRDIFSHTAQGRDWMAHEWLSEVIMALFHDHFGLAGLTLLFFLLTGLTLTLLFRIAMHVSTDGIALVAVGTAAPLMFSHLLARPHIFTWLLASLTIWLLMRADRWLWTLPLLTALWANLHGGVLLSIVFQGVFWLGSLFDDWPGRSPADWAGWWDANRRATLVLLVSLLAVGCNPFGYNLLWLPFYAGSKVFSEGINEWMAPNLQAMWYARLWLLGLFGLAAWYGRRTSWCWRLMAFVLLFQALAHIRHLSIAALALTPWVACALNDMRTILPFRRRSSSTAADVPVNPWAGPVLTIVLWFLLLGVCATRPTWWQQVAQDRFALPESYSTEALAYLEKNGFPGQHLLNEYTWGDYLIYGIDPSPPVFIDGRADMYGEEIFSDYLTLVRAEPDLERVLEKYRIDWVLFPKTHILVRYLNLKPGWREVYSDDEVAILAMGEAGG